MRNIEYKNLVFEGGGILGVAYLGVLDYLSKNKLLNTVQRVAGTSAGAITACVVSFGLPFDEMKTIADSLDFSKVPDRENDVRLKEIPPLIKKEVEDLFGDFDCIYRLIHNYGWYSSNYFYTWIKSQIEQQFDKSKKLPPYTFEDFADSSIHVDNREFKDLYILGADISTNSSMVFSNLTTPNMEVAEAVRISMSIPLFFESVRLENLEKYFNKEHVFSDGGVMRNYPINIFDSEVFSSELSDGVNPYTLGAMSRNKSEYSNINSLLEYIKSLLKSLIKVQADYLRHNPKDLERSIIIDTGNVSSLDFDIKVDDETYTFLYNQGYNATNDYFNKINKAY